LILILKLLLSANKAKIIRSLERTIAIFLINLFCVSLVFASESNKLMNEYAVELLTAEDGFVSPGADDAEDIEA